MSIDATIEFLGLGSSKDWQILERLVAALHGAAQEKVTTTWNDTIDGRQFDVTLRFKHGIHHYLTVIECKHTKHPVQIEKVEAFVTKARGVLANKAVMVSSSGFQEGGVKVAKAYGVKLLTISEKFVDPNPFKVGERFPGISVFDVRVARNDGAPDVKIEESNGKLEYLFNHSTIVHRGRKRSLEQQIQWQCPDLDTKIPTIEEEVKIDLHPGALWQVPFEDVIPINGISFRRKAIEFAAPAEKGVAMLDRWLMEREGLQISVTDESGALLDSKRLREIAFDFDTVLKAGSFYWSASMGFFYYLDRIDGDLLSWILIESYQHGRLIQAEFTQEREHAKGYVDVTDSSPLKRLRRMLAALRAK